MFKLNSKPKRIIFILILTLLVSAFSLTFYVLNKGNETNLVPYADSEVYNYNGTNVHAYIFTDTITSGSFSEYYNYDYFLIKRSGNQGHTITIASSFNIFAGAVNAGYDFSGKTVILDANIDFNNAVIDCIGSGYDSPYGQVGAIEHSFNGTFDGQYHKLSNFTLSDSKYFEYRFYTQIPVGSGSRIRYKTTYHYRYYFGLFNYCEGATIKNVQISNMTSTKTSANNASQEATVSQSGYDNKYYVSAFAGYGSATLNYVSYDINGGLSVDLTNSGSFTIQTSEVVGIRVYSSTATAYEGWIAGTDGFDYSSIGGTFDSGVSGRNKTWYYCNTSNYNNGMPRLRRFMDVSTWSSVNFEARLNDNTTVDSSQTIQLRDNNQTSIGYNSSSGSVTFYYPSSLTWPNSSAITVSENPIIMFGQKIISVAASNTRFIRFELSANTNTQIVRFNSLYTVTYDANKPSTSDQTEKVKLGKTKDENVIYKNSVTLPTASLNGYNFVGWYIYQTGGTMVGGANESYEVTKNITLYAHWTGIEYSIKYYDRGTTTETPEASNLPKKYTCGEGLKLERLTEKIGYYFLDWYDASTGGSVITSISTSTYGDVSVYAEWTAKSYNITYKFKFVSTSGSTEPTNKPSQTSKTYKITDATFVLPTPTKTGYAFSEVWKITSCDGAIKNNNVGTIIQEIPTGSYGNVVLTCKYTATTYSINYYDWDDKSSGDNTAYSGSTISTDDRQYIYSVGKTLPNVTKTGYNFDGYFTTRNGSTQITSISASDIGDKTVYAKWTPITYNITYVLNDDADYPATNSANNRLTYTIETPTITLADATRNYYTFINWYSDEKLTTVCSSIPKGSTGNKTLYAEWKVAEWTVTINKGTITGGDQNGNTIEITASSNCSSADFISGNPNSYVITLHTSDTMNFVCDYNKNEYYILITKEGINYTLTYCLHGDTNQTGYVNYNDPLWKYTIEKTNNNIGDFIVETDDTNYSLTLNKGLNSSVQINAENVTFEINPNFVLKTYNIG